MTNWNGVLVRSNILRRNGTVTTIHFTNRNAVPVRSGPFRALEVGLKQLILYFARITGYCDIVPNTRRSVTNDKSSFYSVSFYSICIETTAAHTMIHRINPTSDCITIGFIYAIPFYPMIFSSIGLAL